MAIPVNQIGPFQFVTLDGVPALPFEHADTIERPGVNGTGFLKTGKRGEEFEITTGVDVATWADAMTVEDDYRNLAHSGVVNITKSGMSYGTIGVGFVIRSVQVVEKFRVANSAGGLVAGGAYVRAKWRCHAVTL